MAALTFKQLSATEWDAERNPFDFHIRLERDEYAVDVFDASQDESDDAYLTTHTCDTWEQVELFCRDYDGKKVV